MMPIPLTQSVHTRRSTRQLPSWFTIPWVRLPAAVGLISWLTAGCLIASPTPCLINIDCPSDHVCVNANYCDYAFERGYDVHLIDARVGPLHPNGNLWNPDGSLPSLYVESGFDGYPASACFTDTIYNTRNPYWNQWCAHYMTETDAYLLNIYQESSTGAHEWVAGWYWDTPADLLDLLRTSNQELQLIDESGTVNLWIEIYPINY